LQQEPFNYERQKIELYTGLFEVYQEMLHAYTAVQALREKIIPEAKHALRDYEKGYAAGRYSFLELTDAQQTLLDARLEIVMASANYHRYRVEIDRLTGARLSTGVK
jgi:cobalt-zinc-cadmium efflux system outer membrane protein